MHSSTVSSTPRHDALGAGARVARTVKPCIIDGVLLVPATPGTLSVDSVHAARFNVPDTAAIKRRQPPRPVATKTKYLSTGRSRLCRQRQKNYVQSLAGSVRALRTELAHLQVMCDLRRDQGLFARNADSGSLARMIRGYYDVFAHGLVAETPAGIPSSSRVSNASNGGASAAKKRSITRLTELSAQAQREFMYSLMDPQVESFDLVGRRVVGYQPLLNGWEMWPYLHASFFINAESVEAIDAAGLFAVHASSRVRVTVSERTLESFFPLAVKDARLRTKLLGKEIVYAMREWFFFSESARVVKYTVDMDFVGALMAVLGDATDVLALAAPFSSMAFRTSCAPPRPPSVSRHDMEFILS